MSDVRGRRKESPELALVRWEKVALVQDMYRNFIDFLEVYMFLEGFTLAQIQYEIAEHISNGGTLAAVFAQRSQAKSSIIRAYLIWSIIHDPGIRIMYLTGIGDLSEKAMVSMMGTFRTMPELECYLPDPGAGDREGVMGFDVHHSLRGNDPNPTLYPRPLMGGLQGYRADIICVDDAELASNSATAVLRESLMQRFRDLASINKGRIIVLGTPQTSESVYKRLPGMGFNCKFWPGRVPTAQQRPYYGDMLAPFVQKMYDDPANRTGYGEDGQSGAPTCPEYLGDEVLIGIERFQGHAFFELQHMLNPSSSEASRKPLDTERILVVPYAQQLPAMVVPQVGGQQYVSVHSCGVDYQFSRPAPVETAYEKPTIMAFVDPALGGQVSKDRTGYAVLAAVRGNIFILDIGSMPGGYSPEVLSRWNEVLSRYKPSTIVLEKNAGYGTVTEVYKPVLAAYAAEHDWQVGLMDQLSKGQKEVRIIETLQPVIGRGSLMVTSQALQHHEDSLTDLRPEDKLVASVWYQLCNITRIKGSLVKDDAIDALAIGVQYLQQHLGADQARNNKALLHNQRVMQVQQQLYPNRQHQRPVLRRIK